MLPKTYRLRLKRDFDRVFKKGKFVGQKLFTLGFAANKLAVSRFAVVVPKKVSKKAVTRNLVKRKTTEIIRLKRNKIKNGFDFVFVAKPEAKGKKYKEIEEELGKILARARLLIS